MTGNPGASQESAVPFDDSKATLFPILAGIALTLAAPVLTFFSLILWLSGMPWTALVTFASGMLAIR